MSHNEGMERRVYRKLPVDGLAAPATLYIYIYINIIDIYSMKAFCRISTSKRETFDYLPCW